MKCFFFHMVVLISTINMVRGQDIYLKNPSFDGNYNFDINDNEIPEHWYSCSRIEFPEYTSSPPDLQPGKWGTKIRPKDGKHYLGMVTRNDETFESVSQKLSTPLLGGHCYKMSVYVAKSDSYMSITKESNDTINFNKPIVLRILGGDNRCDKTQLLAVSSAVNHKKWMKYEFILSPEEDVWFLSLEAFYKTPTPVPYAGNILIDNISPIKIIPCSGERKEPLAIKLNYPPKTKYTTKVENFKIDAIVENISVEDNIKIVYNENVLETSFKDGNIDFRKKLIPGRNKFKIIVETDGENLEKIIEVTYVQPIESTKLVKVENSKMVNRINSKLKDIKKEDLKVGYVINVEHISFDADHSEIKPSVVKTLEDIKVFLDTHDYITVEIGGHTNNTPTDFYCDNLSKARAKSIVNWLVENGVDEERVEFKGYGKRNPMFSNKTKLGRMKNQRVEIKILSIDK